MKKTLLIAAAALAAGVITSQAQVYSQNIVGYVNIPLTAGVLQVVSPALDADGTGTNNTISTVFGTNNVSLGDSVYAYNGTGYDSLSYSKQGHGASAVTGWFLNGSLANNYVINPGVSVFYLPFVSETNTQVGTVLQGTNLVNTYVAPAGGISLVSSIVPIAGGVTTTLGYTPSIGDSIYVYNNGGYDAYSYSKQGHGVSAVTGWFLNGVQTEPNIPVGSGFWLSPFTTTTWTQSFIAQ